ncbi:ABC transporter ATP-binding protein [Deinococcus ruber]|uniref:ABC transporter ATP-binding protein n=1 Tax=Deinococcus ruber TaxID=1848197 RepID=A0A918CPJ4_9DEIO|nr:ABC transporter ATP-binding protein [Deinococcus ruber]GGR31679.1 ABC transporter ATP-binding protein [Deinococcus ruber]
MTTLLADDLFRFYHVGDEETRALRGVSLHVQSGELVAIMGPSGSGKSTLLACLAGLDDPDGGHVEVSGQRLTRRPEAERARLRGRKVGVLLQAENLMPHLSVLENVLLPMRLAGTVDATFAQALLAQVGLSERHQHLPGQLSGGELARAGLAVALAAKPDLLLADEPTAEVDTGTEARLFEVLDAFRTRGGAVLISTHSPALAARADRVLHLKDGILNG